MQLRSGFRGNSRAYLLAFEARYRDHSWIASGYQHCCRTPFPTGSTMSDRQFPRDQLFLVLHTDFGTAASNDDSNDD